MKRKEIRAGVVYAEHSTYGSPSPIVFLQDEAASLFRQDRGHGLVELSSDRYKPSRGWSGTTGYLAMRPDRFVTDHGLPYAERVEALYHLDTAAEMQRFKDHQEPLAKGAEFVLITSLAKFHGEYRAELEAYTRAQEAKEQARDAAARQRDNLITRTEGVMDALRMAVSKAGRPGILQGMHRNGTSTVILPVGDAAALASLLEALAGER